MWYDCGHVGNEGGVCVCVCVCVCVHWRCSITKSVVYLLEMLLKCFLFIDGVVHVRKVSCFWERFCVGTESVVYVRKVLCMYGRCCADKAKLLAVSHKQTNEKMDKQTLVHTYSVTYIRSRGHARTHAYTHTHPHTHTQNWQTQIISLSLSLSAATQDMILFYRHTPNKPYVAGEARVYIIRIVR